jgi:hypothetical protein
MNELVFWLWGPAILVAIGVFGVVLMRRDLKQLRDHRNHPAE